MPREPKANDYQVGGEHYRGKEGTQHWDYAIAKQFDFFQYVITKYVERWQEKDGIKDLKKAQHYLQKYIETIESGGTVAKLGVRTLSGGIAHLGPIEKGQVNPFADKRFDKSSGMISPFGFDSTEEN